MTQEARSQFHDLVGLMSGAELARAWGYDGVNNAFRDQCARLNITSVPGRRGWYDPRLVRRRMDEAQGLLDRHPDSGRELSLVEQRRARLGGSIP